MVRISKWILALALVAGLGQTAQAGLIPAAITVSAAGSNYRFTYSVELPSDYTLKSGDYFTIYDFQGFVSGGPVAQPTGWKFSSAMVGPTPAHIAPMDSATLPNLTWTYSGPNIVGSVTLGQFSAISTMGGQQDGAFTSTDFSTLQGRAVGNYTTTEIPAALVHQTPEPATLALFGAALPLLGVFRWLRRIK